jgi:hypothetical protein
VGRRLVGAGHGLRDDAAFGRAAALGTLGSSRYRRQGRKTFAREVRSCPMFTD